MVRMNQELKKGLLFTNAGYYGLCGGRFSSQEETIYTKTGTHIWSTILRGVSMRMVRSKYDIKLTTKVCHWVSQPRHE